MINIEANPYPEYEDLIKQAISELDIPAEQDVTITNLDLTEINAQFASAIYFISYGETELVLKIQEDDMRDLEEVNEYIRTYAPELADFVMLPNIISDYVTGKSEVFSGSGVYMEDKMYYSISPKASGYSMSQMIEDTFCKILTNTLTEDDIIEFTSAYNELGKTIAKVHLAGDHPNTLNYLDQFITNLMHFDLHYNNIFFDPKTKKISLIDLDFFEEHLHNPELAAEDLDKVLSQIFHAYFYYSSTICEMDQPMTFKSMFTSALKSTIEGYTSIYSEAGIDSEIFIKMTTPAIMLSLFLNEDQCELYESSSEFYHLNKEEFLELKTSLEEAMFSSIVTPDNQDQFSDYIPDKTFEIMASMNIQPSGVEAAYAA